MRLKSIFSLLIISAFISCDKENTPEPEVPAKAVEFSFRYDPYPPEIEEFELVLSQRDGQVLLDTLIATKKEHNLKIRSNDSKFDVTTIIFNPSINRYSVKTYVQVNPDKWQLEVYGAAGNIQTEKAKITYNHIPYNGDFFFGATRTASFSSIWSSNTQTIEFNRALPNDIAYMVLPYYGKYIFAELTSAETVVDFSNAVNTTKRVFNKPEGITDFRTTLYGFPVAGDYSRSMLLYLSDFISPNQYDLHYPETVIKEFSLRNSYIDAGGAKHTYENLSTTVPTELPFASKADFTVTNTAFNDFRITFEDDKPSTYIASWETTDGDQSINWLVSLSPDETDFKANVYLEKVKSIMLAGKNLSSFKLKYIYSQKVNGYSHQDVLDYRAMPYSANKRLQQSRTISKTF